LGIEVDKIYNFPQDIESCVANNKVSYRQDRKLGINWSFNRLNQSNIEVKER